MVTHRHSILQPPLSPPLNAASGSDSAFLLLNTHIAPPTAPRPRYRLVLYAAALLDALNTLRFALGVSEPGESQGTKGLLAWGVLRPLVIAWVTSSARIHQRGWVLLAQVVVTFMVGLYRLNELMQTRPDGEAPHWDPSPSTTYLATSFAFSLIHYALYALVVGIRRVRNVHIVPCETGRGSTSGEGDYDEREASVRFDADTIDEEAALDESFAEEYDGSGTSDTTTDEDEIIDIPHLRSRASRMTIRSQRSGEVVERSTSSERERRSINQTSPQARRVSRYGSINSLAGV